MCIRDRNQPGQVRRHLFDLAQRSTRVLGEARTGDHFRGRLFHRTHRFVGIGLNGLHQRFDASRRAGSTFCEALHFVGHHGETAAGFTGGGGLHGGVERQDCLLYTSRCV